MRIIHTAAKKELRSLASTLQHETQRPSTHISFCLAAKRRRLDSTAPQAVDQLPTAEQQAPQPPMPAGVSPRASQAVEEQCASSVDADEAAGVQRFLRDLLAGAQKDPTAVDLSGPDAGFLTTDAVAAKAAEVPQVLTSVLAHHGNPEKSELAASHGCSEKCAAAATLFVEAISWDG